MPVGVPTLTPEVSPVSKSPGALAFTISAWVRAYARPRYAAVSERCSGWRPTKPTGSAFRRSVSSPTWRRRIGTSGRRRSVDQFI